MFKRGFFKRPAQQAATMAFKSATPAEWRKNLAELPERHGPGQRLPTFFYVRSASVAFELFLTRATAGTWPSVKAPCIQALSDEFAQIPESTSDLSHRRTARRCKPPTAH